MSEGDASPGVVTNVVTWRGVLASELGKAVRARSVQVLVVLELCLVAFFSTVVGAPGVQTAVLPAGLQGVANIPPSTWLEEPAPTVLLAVAWCLPLFLWGRHRLTRKDL